MSAARIAAPLALACMALTLWACQSRAGPPTQPPPPPPDNRPPVAHAGGPYVVTGLTVAFDASASADPDGDGLSFAWQFGDGSTGTGPRPSHAYAGFGSDTVRLAVTDARGATTTTHTLATRREPATLLSGAGNIGSCAGSWDDRTAELLDALPGFVFTAGDNAFPGGSAADYQCYAASWGRHLGRTLPVLGNHEYDADSAAAAFDFFGARLGERGRGYYSTDVGAWHVVVLNDNQAFVPLDAGSEQLSWLRADLAAHPARCTIALWHKPRFLSSTESGYTENPSLGDVWSVLAAAGVDVVINGHRHQYERMAPLAPDGSRDDARGIRQFNAGTGGGVLMPTVMHPHSQALAAEYGVLSLALRPGDYDWRFIPAAGQTFTDSGTGTCH